MSLPKQSKTRTAGGSVLKNARRAETSAKNLNSESLENIPNRGLSSESIVKIKAVQETIDNYNNTLIYDIDPYFAGLQLAGESIIVRLFYEDLIKFIDESNPDDIQIDAWHRQIDARKRATDTAHWVSTPFPYIHSGVIMAISPDLQIEYGNKRKQLIEAGFDTETAIGMIYVPEVGDIVNIRPYESGWFKDHRHYIDKQAQCKDFVRNQDELRLNNFEHYFYVEKFDIEGFITNPVKRGKIKVKDEQQAETV